MIAINIFANSLMLLPCFVSSRVKTILTAPLIVMPSIKRIAVFASGNGSNAENLIRYFRNNTGVAEVALVVCNRRDALAPHRAVALGVDAVVLTRDEINEPSTLSRVLDEHSIDFIVLAGFLLMAPLFLIERYRGRIVNIHPALLPKFGGKGMYGHHVHEAVIAAGERETGITIHHVSERYDEGRIIFQARVGVEPADTPEIVERKVRDLEMRYLPQVVGNLVVDL